jgi:hypothetical protein
MDLVRGVMESLAPKGTVSRRIVDWGLANDDGALRSLLGEWLVRRPLREVTGFSRVTTAIVLGPPPADTVVDLFARLGIRLHSLERDIQERPAVSAVHQEDRATDFGDLASMFEPAPELAVSPRGGDP